MADVRALLAAERQSRRISHPHLTYTKNGALLCNVCNLNVKSEQLWTGHLRSQNHRGNVQNKPEPLAKPVKRKAAELNSVPNIDGDYDIASRKKPKPVSDESSPETAAEPEVSLGPQQKATDKGDDEVFGQPQKEDQITGRVEEPVTGPDQSLATINEDEWAAFERDVAPLAQADYSTATIEAAPVSTAEVEASKQESLRRTHNEDEAEEEKVDESRRMEEEFDYMEEMEERVKRLRDRREALRNTKPSAQTQAEQVRSTSSSDKKTQGDAVLDRSLGGTPPNEPSSDDDEIDDWYG